MFPQVLVFITCLADHVVCSVLKTPESLPYGCSWQREEQHFSYKLKCRLKSVSSVTEVLGNFSINQAKSIHSLGIECPEMQIDESHMNYSRLMMVYGLDSNLLAAMPKLEILRIEHCKIKSLPDDSFSSVKDLRTLVVKTYYERRSMLNLGLHENTLRGLVELRNLDLSNNNFWTLPYKFLCSVSKLITLNLTYNRLQDIASLGSTEKSVNCVRHLESLDLSFNELSKLSNYEISTLQTLTSLNLHNNLITAMADKSLNALSSLRYLNLSNNRLVALPPDLFMNNCELQILALRNNSLTILAPGLLYNLRNLTFLDLSYNNLTSQWENRDTFKYLSNLNSLDLSYNKLTKIDAFIFQDLFKLQLLNLEHNELHALTDKCFQNLKNLRSLALSGNKLKRFEIYFTYGLSLLHQLFLDDNRLEFIHSESFKNLTVLQDMRLSGNLFTKVPKAINSLMNLKTLDLGNNEIRDIDPSSFTGLEKLSGLRLVGNKLENITCESFVSLSSLQILNLASNSIKHIQENSFIKNEILIALRLDSNQLSQIRGLFHSLPALLMLNISDNQLLQFDYSYLPQSLEWLDVHKNRIRKLSDDSGNGGRLRIKKLDASFNVIEEIFDYSIPNSIEKLYLNNNHIHTIAPGTFMLKSNLKKVTFEKNNLQYIDISAVELEPVPNDRELSTFYLGHNPILCNCTMEWLPRVNELSNLRQYPKFVDLHEVTCNMMHARAMPQCSLLSLKAKDFLCHYSTHCFSICHCCDFDACDCKMTCPMNCSCYHDHSWSNNVVDCTDAGYTIVPNNIPMDATEIYLDANNFSTLGSHLFIGKRKLEILYLNHSAISTIHNRTFTGVESLKILHLNFNLLTELKGSEFDQLTKLTELYLDSNSINIISNMTFRKLHNLRSINLSHNRLLNFKPWESFTKQPHILLLEGNVWLCNCTMITKLSIWLVEHQENRGNFMYCHDNIKSLSQAIERCANPSTEAVHRGVIVPYNPTAPTEDLLPVLMSILAIVLALCLFVTLALIIHQNKKLLNRRWCPLHTDQMQTPFDEENEKLYDGYVVYDEHDEDFVYRFIAAELEHDGFALCLHWRDLPSNRCQQCLPQAANSAKRFIIVFSRLFLNNEWQRLDFRESLKSTFENISLEFRSRYVIVILAVEVPTDDAELQLLLRNCTVIIWGEKMFLDNLRSAMPETSRPVKKTDRFKQENNSQTTDSIKYLTSSSTAMATWASKSTDAPTQAAIQIASVHRTIHVLTPTPTQSTYISSSSSRTEDEDSTSEHHIKQQRQSIYKSLHCHQRLSSTAPKTSHLYSTIPESTIHNNMETFSDIQIPNRSRTYFV